MNKTAHLTGLTEAEVIKSREQYGANILTPAKKKSLFRCFLEKFRDPLIIILLVAGVLSILISLYEYYCMGQGTGVFFEPAGIFIAIILATGLAFFFEVKADREFAILNRVNDDESVRVIRAGNTIEIPRRDVVAGDIVILSTGDGVPADGQLLEAMSLTLDESTLTGEPSCHKTVNPADFDKEATYRSDYVLRGTKVMEGHGIFRVEKVGDATENGKVFHDAQIDNSVKTPLNEQLDRLGTLISRMSYCVGALVIVGRCLMYALSPEYPGIFTMEFAAYFLQTLMLAVTLVVVSVPEGLPMAVTLSLAYSMRRMLRTNNLVRKMHACETMGATTVICTDKTGTLTQNRMQVAEMMFGTDVAADIINEGIAVNSTATLDLSGDTPKALGNPTEGALLLYLHGRGIDHTALSQRAARLDELPFSTERKFMATAVQSGVNSKRMLYVKGAPEIVMEMCSGMATGLTAEEINRQLLDYQRKGMRTLGFAYATLPDNGPLPDLNKSGTRGEGIGPNPDDTDLKFIGIAAISDPVREDVPAAVRECLDAGIDIKIVTGDTPATAREIGRQIGLVNDSDGEECIITGPEFEALTDAELYDRAGDFKVIARARPGDKKRLVETLQHRNEVVAVTGDGTNDAPALKAAHVGLSMGDGTSVAKEASDITIIDNSFSSIGRAVMWGRSLYQNIQRFVLFQLTVNVVACLIVLSGAFMGTDAPLTVTQMLWVNLIMDTFAAMALASLPPSRSVMQSAPRDRKAFIITPGMWRFIIGVGGVFFLLLFGLLYTFEHAEITSTADLLHPELGGYKGLDPDELSLFFTIFVFLQFWNMFNARAFMTGRSAFHLKGCGEFEFIALAIFFGQIIIVQFGGEFFNVVPLGIKDWLTVIAGTSPVLIIGEAIRLFKLKA
ncbi:MAG: calcium-translocating P-type ATPase, PMCA-type [Muribaculaceae bacterium]|nr:calcium-translocating P-type ATPase, PMCA-type [Muribaculaceae bacterium]